MRGWSVRLPTIPVNSGHVIVEVDPPSNPGWILECAVTDPDTLDVVRFGMDPNGVIFCENKDDVSIPDLAIDAAKNNLKSRLKTSILNEMDIQMVPEYLDQTSGIYELNDGRLLYLIPEIPDDLDEVTYDYRIYENGEEVDFGYIDLPYSYSYLDICNAIMDKNDYRNTISIKRVLATEDSAEYRVASDLLEHKSDYGDLKRRFGLKNKKRRF